VRQSSFKVPNLISGVAVAQVGPAPEPETIASHILGVEAVHRQMLGSSGIS
jgi:hypothetical protein